MTIYLIVPHYDFDAWDDESKPDLTLGYFQTKEEAEAQFPALEAAAQKDMDDEYEEFYQRAVTTYERALRIWEMDRNDPAIANTPAPIAPDKSAYYRKDKTEFSVMEVRPATV